MVDWYNALGRMRAEALLKRGFVSGVEMERETYLQALDHFVSELIAITQPGQGTYFAEHLRLLGSNYELWPVVKHREGPAMNAFNTQVNDGLVKYGFELALREDIPFKEKMQVLEQTALGVLALRHIRGSMENAAVEIAFTDLVDQLTQSHKAERADRLSRLEADMRYTVIKEKLAPELWTGGAIIDIDKQAEPKPYKRAIQMFQYIAGQAESLLNQGALDEAERWQAERLALEARTWACQQLQDKGIVMSNDFDLAQAKAELDKMLAARQRVEQNPAQTAREATLAIHKSRLIELDFYKYHEKKEGFQKIAELTESYLPAIFPTLEGPFPDPEGKPEIRYGAVMMLWRGVALLELGRLDEAIAMLEKIKLGMSDRYNDPLIGGVAVRGLSLLYLNKITRQREEAKKNEQKGGMN